MTELKILEGGRKEPTGDEMRWMLSCLMTSPFVLTLPRDHPKALTMYLWLRDNVGILGERFMMAGGQGEERFAFLLREDLERAKAWVEEE